MTEENALAKMCEEVKRLSQANTDLTLQNELYEQRAESAEALVLMASQQLSKDDSLLAGIIRHSETGRRAFFDRRVAASVKTGGRW